MGGTILTHGEDVNTQRTENDTFTRKHWNTQMLSEIGESTHWGLQSQPVIISALVGTPELLREYVIAENSKGLLRPSALRKALGYKPKSSMVNQILNRKKPLPMDRIDQVAAFFGFDSPEAFIEAARIVAAKQSKEPLPAPPATEGFRQEERSTGTEGPMRPRAHARRPVAKHDPKKRRR